MVEGGRNDRGADDCIGTLLGMEVGCDGLEDNDILFNIIFGSFYR